MRHRGKRFAAVVLAAGLSALAWCGVGHAQDTVVVSNDAESTAGYQDVAAGIQEAVRLSRENGTRVRVQIIGSVDENGDPVAYPVENPIAIPADADIHILGVVLDTVQTGPDGETTFTNGDSRPWRVIIEAGNGLGNDPLIEVHTEEDTYEGEDSYLNYRPGNATNNILIEGITLRGAETGIRIGSNLVPSDDASLAPQISRCIILGSGTATHKAGIDIQTNAAPVVANCVVGAYDVGTSKYDSNIGIHVKKDGALDLIFGSILFNDKAGIRANNGAGRVRIRNTLVYDNGTDIDDNTHGGIVFETNPFITPSSGPYNVTTPVTISGANFTDPNDVSAVYFGPPDRDGTVGANLNLVSETSLTVNAPPSYLGTPGPVDVTIVRGDGQEVTVKQGFLYTAAADVPVVTQAVPGEGPIDTGDTWIAVYGYGFEKDCQVWFDLSGNGAIDEADDLASPRMQFFSSSYLWVQVPEHGVPTAKMDVLVRTSAGDSPAGQLKEFQYTGLTTPPVITQVAPDVVRDLQGTGDGGSSQTIDIIGWNFGPGADASENPDPVIVKIGGIACSYDEINQGENDDNGDSLDEIVGVAVPVAAFGAGGSYDVEVINTDGQRAVMPHGLTYFADGTPDIDEGRANAVAFPWVPANFAIRQAGSASYRRTLLGSGFDTGLAITLSSGGNAFVVDEAGGDGVLLPNEEVFPHTGHTQRAIDFDMPPLPEDAFGFDPDTETMTVSVANVSSVDGSSSAVQNGEKTVSEDFHWVSSADALEIRSVQWDEDANAWIIDADGINEDTKLYINGIEQPDVKFGSQKAPWAFEPPAGLYGLLDVTLENPGPPRIYYTQDNAFSLPRLDDVGEPLAPQIYAVEPNVWPAAGGIEVRVYGSGFLGPYDGNRVFTDVGVGTNTAVATNTGLALVSGYEVVSEGEIRFTLENMTAAPPRASIPGPVDVAVLHVDPADSANVVQGGEIQDAVYIMNSNLRVSDIYRADRRDPASPDFYPERFGSVRGGDIVTVEGSGFTDVTRFFIGKAEAKAAPATWTREDGSAGTAVASPTERTLVTPPAVEGLPGTVDVMAVDGDAQALALDAFTYILDGAPTITQISPNRVSREASNDAAAREGEEGIYFTIYGTNFDNIVTVLFDVGDDEIFEFEGEVFSTSPYEMVVKAPASDALALTDEDYEDGQVEVAVRVFNGRKGEVDLDLGLDSNTEPVYYYDDSVDPLETAAPVLAFNDVYLNSRDYLNAQPGVGSISVDPMLDPGPADERRIGPKAVTRDAVDWWLGKLALSGGEGDVGDNDALLYNPLRDKAGDFAMGSFSFEDLELDPRPNADISGGGESFHGQGPVDSAKSDIGADEINENGAVEASWYFAEITPNPIGKAAAESVEVEVRLRGIEVALADGDIFLVPQGGEPNEDAHRMYFRITESYGGSGSALYYATNIDRIDTILLDRGEAELSAEDLVVDGHAALFVTTTAGVLGLLDSVLDDDLLDPYGGGYITGDAVEGRHALIDTTPPRVFIEGFTAGMIGPWDLVPAGETNDTYSITRSDMDTASDAAPNHAGLALPAQTWPTGFWYNQNAAYMGIAKPDNWNVPAAWEGVLAYPKGGNIPQVFFNTGSLANGAATVTGTASQEDLDFTLKVRLVDPVVTTKDDVSYLDATNYVVAGEDGSNIHLDRYSGLFTRQVSGFEAASQTFDDVTRMGGPGLLPARLVHTDPPSWGDFASGASGEAEFETDSSGYAGMEAAPGVSLATGEIASNVGYDLGPPDVFVTNNNQLEATWRIQGLDWNAARLQAMRWALHFAGRDRAGNETDTSGGWADVVVHWGLDVQTEITQPPAASNNYLASWGLLRGQAGTSGPPTMSKKAETEEGPAPLFMYRLFINYENPGLVDGRYWHVYTSAWSTRTAINREDIRAILEAGGFEPDVNQYYLMLVVLGADEAGNVEPWLREVPYYDDGITAGEPGDPLFDVPFQPVDFRGRDIGLRRQDWANRLPNIVRFAWTGTEVPDTRVSAVFWHGDGAAPIEPGADERQGSNPRVVMPEEGSGQSVDAEFIIGAEYRDRTDLRVMWELLSGNEIVDSSALRNQNNQADYRYPTFSPDDAEQNPVEAFALGDPARREAKTYTFRAAAFVDSDNNRVYSEGEPIDPTWANLSFVVTPYSVDPGLDPLDQPIAVTEEQ